MEGDMEGGRSSKVSEPASRRAGTEDAAAMSSRGKRKSVEAPAGLRTIVLEGTFSIEEIEMAGESRRKVAQAAMIKVTKKKAARKKSAKKKVARKKSAKKKVARKAVKPKAAQKRAAPKSQLMLVACQQSIKNIAELDDRLKALVTTDTAVVIDASQVESIDTASLQLLVAFANTRREKSAPVEWKEASDDFRGLVELADLGQHLGLDDGSAVESDDGLCPVF